MTSYTKFNLVVLGACALLTFPLYVSKQRFLTAIRTATFVTVLAFPWDFFAIWLNVWDYSDPGPRLFSVPVNDLIFIFSCTYFSSMYLLSLDRAPCAGD